MAAAAMGVPVIATAIRGCRQVVDDGVTGTLVPARDAAAIERAIAALAEDPDRRRAMGRAGIQRAAEQFDQRRVIDITLDAYDRLLNK